jgi:4-hydroxy-3-methylbut-2-enyl diphosphate reductase
VKELLPHVQLLLVIGSHNSSNSRRLVEVAHAADVEARLLDDAGELEETWFRGVETVGVTSGASAPETLVAGVCDWFRARGVADIRELRPEREDVVFRLPAELERSRRPAA